MGQTSLVRKVTDDGSFTVSDGFDETQVTQIEDDTTSSGSANAATLALGDYRHKVDVVVNGSASNWTVTVEVQDANDDWIQYGTFSQDGTDDDVIQLETMATDVRAYFDQDVTRLTIASKGAQ